MPIGTKGVWQRNPETKEVNKVYWCATSGCNFKSLVYDEVKEHCAYEHGEGFEEEAKEEEINEEDDEEEGE